jgi:hypothetical protein
MECWYLPSQSVDSGLTQLIRQTIFQPALGYVIWLVVYLPLWKIVVITKLGWLFHSPLIWKIIQPCSSQHQPVGLSTDRTKEQPREWNPAATKGHLNRSRSTWAKIFFHLWHLDILGLTFQPSFFFKNTEYHLYDILGFGLEKKMFV